MRSKLRPLAEGYLSSKEKDATLESLMVLKEKCDGRIKGWACADGRKYRPGSSKEDATSPTVSLEEVLISSVIDTYEE